MTADEKFLEAAKTYKKIHSTDNLSDEEIANAIRVFTLMIVFMSENPKFHFFREALIKDLDRLREYKAAREEK